MSIPQLQEQLRDFYKDRNWDQFHNPKNLVMALSGEVGELTELFQWLDLEQSRSIMGDEKNALNVQEEMADIFVYLVTLADKLGIDLLKAAEDKIEKNKAKYPVEKSWGNSKKYSEL